MNTFVEFHITSITADSDPVGGWIYRFITDEAGVTIFRVPENNRLWGHSIIKQVYLPDEDRFDALANSGIVNPITFEQARLVVAKQQAMVK